jgi:lipopolysaccharide export system protein LptC
MISNPEFPDPDDAKSAGLTRLVRTDDDAAATVAQSVRHSSIVRRLRLVLPLVAIGIVVIMLAWSDMDKIAEPVRREEVSPQTMGKNELVKPKFQSEDTNQQPYTITADRAFQEADNLDLVILEKPVADITLEDGAWIAIKAKNGEYLQSRQKLKLTGDVRLYHDDGYELATEQVDLDIISQTAHSDKPVSGHGPAGTITSSGLDANGRNGTLIFTGPAKLILHTAKPIH